MCVCALPQNFSQDELRAAFDATLPPLATSAGRSHPTERLQSDLTLTESVLMELDAVLSQGKVELKKPGVAEQVATVALWLMAAHPDGKVLQLMCMGMLVQCIEARPEVRAFLAQHGGVTVVARILDHSAWQRKDAHLPAFMECTLGLLVSLCNGASAEVCVQQLCDARGAVKAIVDVMVENPASLTVQRCGVVLLRKVCDRSGTKQLLMDAKALSAVHAAVQRYKTNDLLVRNGNAVIQKLVSK